MAHLVSRNGIPEIDHPGQGANEQQCCESNVQN